MKTGDNAIRSDGEVMVEPPRVIGPVAGFCVVAGSMLGVGIFLFPSMVAQEVGSVAAFFFLWVLGGLFALAGASACAELSTLFPRAGGDYVFQREAFGQSVAFASGWLLFIAIFGGSIAGMAVAVVQYQVQALVGYDLSVKPILGLPITAIQWLAIVLIIVLTLLNVAGTRLAARTQVLLTLLPIIGLVMLALYGFATGAKTQPALLAEPSMVAELSFAGFVTGFLLVNFAYSGWINIIYVAGEVREPHRNIPRSMFGATFFVTGLYCLLCAAFIAVLGFSGLAALGWTDAGTGMAQALQSSWLTTAVLILIAVAIITSLNATVLGGARVAYAMAVDGCFWRGAARLSGSGRVPKAALWLQAAFAIALVLTGSFRAIVEMTSIAMFMTGTLSVLAMFALRRRLPGVYRPYRASFYPWLPGLYVVLSCVAIVATAWRGFRLGGEAAYYPILGVLILLVTYLAHRWHVRRRLLPETSY
ncbi:hypothetical protein CAI21_12550 [Alkalilimnicola ehrlichii]|uniref:Amino acid permease n=1 Tax=Alkalilimnicola ehrlichii TaxID=351052 RepID=A0A3E0X2G3_9GAMM|nr:APC family permease [Alkalilimnicola ehrlichii]RFA28393.1 hypothetical protein CAI21_12550 [Alkalilimnicola ehrlichii]RFA38542.1 hypothetical protein CAL65_04110 [Alkalilimnicola ehrlichii]